MKSKNFEAETAAEARQEAEKFMVGKDARYKGLSKLGPGKFNALVTYQEEETVSVSKMKKDELIEYFSKTATEAELEAFKSLNKKEMVAHIKALEAESGEEE